jgi:hypothetical protein
MFWCLFLLNETACLGKKGVVSCFVSKKKEKEEAQNNVVLNGIVLLHPLDTQRQGKKKFLSRATPHTHSLSLSLPTCPNLDTTHASHPPP